MEMLQNNSRNCTSIFEIKFWNKSRSIASMQISIGNYQFSSKVIWCGFIYEKKNNFHPNVPLSLCLELVVCSRYFSTLNKMHINLNSLVTMVSGSQQPSMFLIFIFIMRMKTTNKWTWGQVFINWESRRSAKSISAAQCDAQAQSNVICKANIWGFILTNFSNKSDVIWKFNESFFQMVNSI